MCVALVIWFPIGKTKDDTAYITRTLRATYRGYWVTSPHGTYFTEYKPVELSPDENVREDVEHYYNVTNHIRELRDTLRLWNPQKRGDLFDSYFRPEDFSIHDYIRIHGILYMSMVKVYARFRIDPLIISDKEECTYNFMEQFFSNSKPTVTMNQIQRRRRLTESHLRIYHVLSDDITHLYSNEEFPYDVYSYNHYHGTVLDTIRKRRFHIHCNLGKDNGHHEQATLEIYHDVDTDTDISISVRPLKRHNKLKHTLGHKGWSQRHRGWKYLTKNRHQWMHNL